MQHIQLIRRSSVLNKYKQQNPPPLGLPPWGEYHEIHHTEQLLFHGFLIVCPINPSVNKSNSDIHPSRPLLCSFLSTNSFRLRHVHPDIFLFFWLIVISLLHFHLISVVLTRYFFSHLAQNKISFFCFKSSPR